MHYYRLCAIELLLKYIVITLHALVYKGFDIYSVRAGVFSAVGWREFGLASKGGIRYRLVISTYVER